jgi:hypothetical protein
MTRSRLTRPQTRDRSRYAQPPARERAASVAGVRLVVVAARAPREPVRNPELDTAVESNRHGGGAGPRFCMLVRREAQ